MPNLPVIQTTDLVYRYAKDAPALAGLNLRVEPGSIYGFLGPNGSGKTTTLRLLLGLLPLQQGSIRLLGHDLHANRIPVLRRIGSLIESPSLYGHLTARENLEVYRGLYGASRARLEEVLTLVGLARTGTKRFKQFSLGMKQRLAIALALLPSPELLILDEPTNGLDPSGIIELRELMLTLRRESGLTILVSSHILSEVEKMVSHLGIIAQGRLLFQGPIQDLYQYQPAYSQLLIHTSDNEMAARALTQYTLQRQGDLLAVTVRDQRQAADISRTLLAQDLDLYLLQPKSSDLEQLFIDLTASHA